MGTGRTAGRKLYLALALSAGVFGGVLSAAQAPFVPVLPGAGRGNGQILAADLDGDGWDDMVINGGVVLLSNGDGTFRTVFNHHLTAGPGELTGGDFNGDGRFDLAKVNYPGRISMLMG